MLKSIKSDEPTCISLFVPLNKREIVVSCLKSEYEKTANIKSVAARIVFMTSLNQLIDTVPTATQDMAYFVSEGTFIPCQLNPESLFSKMSKPIYKVDTCFDTAPLETDLPQRTNVETDLPQRTNVETDLPQRTNVETD